MNYPYHAELCKTSLFYHTRVGMGYDYIPDDLSDLCNWVQRLWEPLKPKRTNAIVQMMRDSFKSTALTQSLPSFYLNQNPNLSILIASKVDTNAKGFLSAQSKGFESDRFINMFGKWRGRFNKWNDTEIVINPREVARKEPSIRAAGTSTTLTSQHYNVIIADDITTKEDMYSPAAREESRRYLQSLYDLIDKQAGFLLLIGTVWHNNDALEATKKANKQKIKQGLLPFKIYERPIKNKQGKPCFSWITEQMIAQIRADKADSRDFAANYLLQPIPDDSKIYWSKNFYYFDYMRMDKEKVDVVVMFVDPSLEETKKNCYSAIVSIAILDNFMYVVDCDAGQRAPSKTIHAIEERFNIMKREFPNAEIMPYLESVMFQKFMQEMAVKEWTENGKDIPLMPSPQHTNKIARITAMEKKVSSGQIKFRKDWQDLPGMKILFEQLENFPNDFMDCPDALEGAVKKSQTASVNIASVV